MLCFCRGDNRRLTGGENGEMQMSFQNVRRHFSRCYKKEPRGRVPTTSNRARCNASSAHEMDTTTTVAAAPMKTDKKVLTLLMVVRDGSVLLGEKKRGFGEGFYNGFGGKVEGGETVEEAALRELEEEAGIKATDASKRLDRSFAGPPARSFARSFARELRLHCGGIDLDCTPSDDGGERRL